MLKFLALQGDPYVYDISSLRVKDKQCIELVIIHIIHDVWSMQHVILLVVFLVGLWNITSK
jgi:hypothetical protein